MKTGDKNAWVESISDTVIGTLINFPLNLILLTITFAMEFTVLWTAIASWAVFTVVAVVRKYLVRKHFAKRNR